MRNDWCFDSGSEFLTRWIIYIDGLEYYELDGMDSKEIDADERLNGGREDEEIDSSTNKIQEHGKNIIGLRTGQFNLHEILCSASFINVNNY